ncbi:hypothetical protein ABI59_07970 [Acidobacteria bacterium Mor1]|nr:hypothetical protein ABI59_07970 [Acidobacteria bacterium Mor1]
MSGLPNWARPHFVAGGGDAYLAFAVYGDLPNALAVPGRKYRVGTMPDGLEVTSHTSGSRSGPDPNRQGAAWDLLLDEHPNLAARIETQSRFVAVNGSIAAPSDLNYLRDVVGLIQWLFDSGGIATYDPQALKWWDREEWRDHAFESTTGAPNHQVVILSTNVDNGEWLHTRGMRKYGRPDLSIHSVPRELRTGAVELLRRFIDFQALGGRIQEGQAIEMNGLPRGMTCAHRGTLDDPDFNNRHLEILWPMS